MRIPLLGLIVVLAAAGCSDQGAVKSAPPEPKEALSDVPPLVSARETTPSALPPGHPPLDAAAAAPQLPPVPAGAGTGAAALAWTSPTDWTEEKPSSPMRRAQYKVPGRTGEGECVVFYFGPGQGGDPISNAKRWASQFSLPDGSSAEDTMKTTELQVSGFNVVVVEVEGTYNGGMTMTAEPATPKPGYRLLGAVAEGPDANWYFKFTGPDATVRAQRAAFEGMVKSLKRGA